MPVERISDTFNRADAGTLGANWSTVAATGFTALQIVSNQAKGTAAGDNGDRWTGAGWTSAVDQYVEGVIGVAPPGGTGGLALLFRMNATDTFYFGQLTPGGGEGTHFSVQKVIGGAFTLLQDVISPYMVGDLIRFSVIGTTITANRNGGTNVLSFTDPAIDGVIVGGTNVGVGIEGTTGAWESWAAGDFAGSGNPKLPWLPRHTNVQGERGATNFNSGFVPPMKAAA